jgi:K+-sensing histidine kinase KdpD
MDNIVEKIIDIKERLMGILSLDEVYKDIVEEGVRFVEAKYGSLMLYQDHTFRRVYGTLPFSYLTKSRKKGNVYRAFSERKIQIVHIAEMERSHPELHEMGVKTSVFIPLIDNKAVLGILVLNFGRVVRDDEEKYFRLFASIAATAIKRVQYYEETREALTMKDNFLEIISHEVRTPLTTITGYLQLMKRKLEKGQGIQSSWIDQGIEEGEKIVKKVKDLVAANDIQRGNGLPFLFEQINLRNLIESSLKYLKNHYPGRNVMTEGNIPKEMWVVGDAIKLEYVFHNLLENSVKFSPIETTTVIRVEEKKDEYQIIIIDQGQGMTRDEMKKIFQGFYKTMKDAKSGMGIGLYLSHHILREHHGGLRIVSRLNTGTNVTIRLPKSNL